MFSSEILTSGGVFFGNFDLGGVFSENGRKSRNLVRAKSPNLSVLVVGRVLTTCPGPTVMGSQKYFKSRKCQGWVSSWGYAVYLDLEVGATVQKCGKVKRSKGRFLQCNKAAVSVE